MIDTHTHLYFTEDYPDGDTRASVERALAAGVSHMVFPAVGLDSMEEQIALHSQFPEATSLGVGIHPENIIDHDWRPQVDDMFARFEGENPIAVGEVGVDLYYDKTNRIEQMDAFGYQIDKAAGLGLPLIVHSRAALDDTLHMLDISGGDKLKGIVFHSFTTGPEDARRIMAAYPGAYFGINGVVTFKNAPDLRDAVKEIGIERIVLETDAPYLAPVPLRGRINESSYLPHILAKIAELTGHDAAEAERMTDANAKALFSKICQMT